MATHLSRSDADETLFEIVESDRLVFFTGSGFSADLESKYGGRIPTWTDLLVKIRHERTARGTPAAADHLLDLLVAKEADGASLVEAASILRGGFEREFDRIAADHLTPAPLKRQRPAGMREHLRKQDALLGCRPCGIVTVNVDVLHERHLARRGLRQAWNFADPLARGGSEQLRQVMVEAGRKPFLVKAHGTLGKNIAFDFNTYRRLLSESPVYHAFMTNLFTNFRVVFVGFGLSDLDFDFFLQAQALALGDPVRTHVALVRRFGRSRADVPKKRRAVVLQRRFGIEYRWYGRYAEVPEILERAARSPGKRLKEILRGCLDRTSTVRSEAHAALANLGPVGKHVAVVSLVASIRGLVRRRRVSLFRLSELVYSLGKLNPPLAGDRELARQVLLEVLQTTDMKEVAAHALVALNGLAVKGDLAVLEALHHARFWEGLRETRQTPDPHDRIPVYLRYLMLTLMMK